MIRIMPDMQTGPVGYFIAWGLLIVIAVGGILATGIGGAIVWAVFWVAVAVVVYAILSKGLRRVT